MTLGPSRRSNSKLALENSFSLQTARADVAKRQTYHDAFRRIRVSRTLDAKALKPLRRRFPFYVWTVSISIYCCIMYIHMNMSLYRGHRQSVDHRTFINPTKPKLGNKQSSRGLDKVETSQSYQKELSVTEQEGRTKAFGKATSQNQGHDHVIDSKLVHVVETRFMQRQSSLLELGLARLALFEAFCLPTMLSQSNGEFIWIIRGDPNLHPSIVSRMQVLLEGKPNFIFMGSNANPEGFGRSDGHFEDFLRADPRDPDRNSAPVWSGNISLVKENYELSAADTVLLETRLDADDGLHIDFVKALQEEARSSLATKSDNVHETNVLWKLWCIDSKIEWHPLNPFPEVPEIAASKSHDTKEGYLVLYSDKTCVTPGLTFGYGPNVNRESLGFDHLRHDEIDRKVPKCKKESDDVQVECVSRFTDLVPGAIRARTTTSAGMKNVMTGNYDIDKRSSIKKYSKDQNLIRQFFQQERLWKGLSDVFSVTRQGVRFAETIMVDRMQEIAMDNLRGQCTPGHSCKNATKEVLGIMADV